MWTGKPVYLMSLCNSPDVVPALSVHAHMRVQERAGLWHSLRAGLVDCTECKKTLGLGTYSAYLASNLVSCRRVESRGFEFHQGQLFFLCSRCWPMYMMYTC